MSFILLSLLLLPGCVKKAPLPWIGKMMTMSGRIGPEEILRLPQGNPVSFTQLIDDLHGSTVIFVGESHDQLEHHQIQLKILQALKEKGEDVVIAMEMFQRPQQPILDRWSQGQLTEEEFLSEVDWENTWGFDYPLYRGILEEAKNNHLSVLALNVPRDLVRTVAEKGKDGLSSEEKKRLPEMDLSDQEHRAYIATIFRSHYRGSARNFERFYEAQCLWDEGMAESLSDFLRSSESREKTVLVFAGNGHVAFDFGIPSRFYRRTPSSFKTIVLKEWTRKLDEDLAFSGSSQPLADFLWITQPTPPEQKRPRIGLVLKLKDPSEGLTIERVIPGSPADKAGLLVGDRLLSVEGIPITEVKEVHEILLQKGWGAEITVTVEREGLTREVKVTLPPLAD